MPVFMHPNGYYGFNLMFNGKRYCHTFKGLSKKEVEAKEMELKLSLINNTPNKISAMELLGQYREKGE